MDTPVGTLLRTALASVVAGGVRLFPGLADDGAAAPYMVYVHFGPINNYLAGRAKTQSQRVQLDVYAATYAAAHAIAEAVQVAMGLQSAYGSPNTFSSMQVDYTYWDRDRDVKLHRITLEFSVWFFEP